MNPVAAVARAVPLERDAWRQGTAATRPGTLVGWGRLAIVALALLFGLGDIAQGNLATEVVLTVVHALPLALIGLMLLDAIRARCWPRYPAALALPMSVWLGVLVASAALAPSHWLDALAALARPVTGALLAWSVVRLCARPLGLGLLVSRALGAGTLLVAAAALAEATGVSFVTAALDGLRDGDIPIGDVPRVAATLSHPNVAAMLLELGLPLVIAWAWTTSSRWKLVLQLSSAAIILALVLTFSRAGVVTALLSLGLLAALAWPHRQNRREQLAFLASLGLVVPLALAWTAVVDPGLDRRLLAGLDESSATQPPRTEFWSVALQMQHDAPLVGVGPDNFRWLFASYSGVQTDNLGIHAHNQYLEALADTGVLGLVSLLWVLGALVVHAIRALKRAGTDWSWRAALLASLGAWLVHALVDDFERFWPSSIAFWLLAGLSLSRLSD